MFYDRKIKYLDYLENGVRVRGAGYVKMEVRDGSLRMELTVTGLHPTDSFTRDIFLYAGERQENIGKIEIAAGRGQYRQRGSRWDNIGGTGISYGELRGVRILLGAGREITCVWQAEKPVKENAGGMEFRAAEVQSQEGKHPVFTGGDPGPERGTDTGEGKNHDAGKKFPEIKWMRKNAKEGNGEQRKTEQEAAAIKQDMAQDEIQAGPGTERGREVWTQQADQGPERERKVWTQAGPGPEGEREGWTQAGPGMERERKVWTQAGPGPEGEREAWTEPGTGPEGERKVWTEPGPGPEGERKEWTEPGPEAEGERKGWTQIGQEADPGPEREREAWTQAGPGPERERKEWRGPERENRDEPNSSQEGRADQRHNPARAQGTENNGSTMPCCGQCRRKNMRMGQEDRREEDGIGTKDRKRRTGQQEVGFSGGAAGEGIIGRGTGKWEVGFSGGAAGEGITGRGTGQGEMSHVMPEEKMGIGMPGNRNTNAGRGKKPVRLSEDKWSQLWEIYPHIKPFQDEREYLSIGPSDFVLFSAASYKMVNNSFLLHGYYNYRHLILAKIEQKGEDIYYVGVPGTFYEKEKQVAIMFGFESFECAEEPAQAGDFGYYMMRTEL